MKKDKFERIYELVCVSAPLSSCTIAGGSLLGLEIGTVMILSGASLLISPFILKGMEIAKDKSRDNSRKRTNYYIQSFNDKFSSLDEDSILNFETSSFYQFIDNKLNETLVPRSLVLDSEAKNNINQFLYLINSNYYYSIKETNFDLRRDKLIDKVLTNIINFMERNKISTFDSKIAKKALEKCDVIDDGLKKKIISEYRNGRVSFNGISVYSVDSRRSEFGKRVEFFDVNNSSDYSFIISYVEEMQDFKNTNLKDLEWDIEGIKSIFLEIKDNYMSYINCNSDFDLMKSIIISSSKYVVKNKCTNIGLRECVGGIYDCSNISSLVVKNDIVGHLMSKGVLDSILRSKSDEKNKEKVIAKPSFK